MRKICFLLVFLIFQFIAYASDIPQPVGWVNDFAGVLSQQDKERLNSLIEELEQKTTTEIAVVTVNSISPYGEIEYARLLFDNWKPGKKGKDNGVLVLLAVKERRWRIETGYGVEGILPDGLCGDIGRNYMVPYFKQGKYSEGLFYGVNAIIKVLTNGSMPTYPSNSIEAVSAISSKDPFTLVAMTFLFSIFSFMALLNYGPLGILFGLLFFFGSLGFSFISAFFVLIASILALMLRHYYWNKLPLSKRHNFFAWNSGGSYGGGGFGGGGFGGGGFGGGCGGGGGAGGGF